VFKSVQKGLVIRCLVIRFFCFDLKKLTILNFSF